MEDPNRTVDGDPGETCDGGLRKSRSARAPSAPSRTLRQRAKAPHSACPRTSRETLRRRNEGDCLMGREGGDEGA